jgi:hypothetical protein
LSFIIQLSSGLNNPDKNVLKHSHFYSGKIADLIFVNLFQAHCFREFIGWYGKFKKYDGRKAK